MKPAPNEIRLARSQNPALRERDLAAQLGVSEAELVAAHCGDGVLRIEPRVNEVLTGLGAVGEVMALTRNESAPKIAAQRRPHAGVGGAAAGLPPL